MSVDPRSIRSVIVAGGGVVGWSAAAAIKRHLRHLTVTIIPTPPPPDALADRIGPTLPSAVGFHRDLGLTEVDTVSRTGSAYRLGTIFEDWTTGRPPYVTTYAAHGAAFDGTPFHLHWIRAAREGTADPFEDFSAASVMARAGRFVHSKVGENTFLSGVEYGLQLNPPGYLQMMRAYARHVGVEERQGTITGVRLREGDGFVDSVSLGDGGQAEADLFVDCTGPAARIRSALDDRFESWSHWLPCDRVIFAGGPPPGELPVLDEVVAMPAGWRWQAACPGRTSLGLVYAETHLRGSEAEVALKLGSNSAGAPVPIRQGRRVQPWLRNCVAVGDAAVAVEPLEWTNLHLAHSAIDRIVTMLPDRDCDPIELAEYNRQAEAEADRVRDFLVLHYVTANRPEPFWQEAARVSPPSSLAHSLTMFRERGRLPFYEEETFSRDSWLAVLFGQGVIPRRTDPLTDHFPPEQARVAMGQLRDRLSSLAATLPSHSAYLRHLSARTTK